MSVTRSANLQGISSTFTLQFTTPGYLLNDAILEVQLPLNQITVAQGSADFTFSDPNKRALSLGFTQTSTSSTYLTYQTQEWMCTSNGPKCDAGLSFTIEIANAANPFI